MARAQARQREDRPVDAAKFVFDEDEWTSRPSNVPPLPSGFGISGSTPSWTARISAARFLGTTTGRRCGSWSNRTLRPVGQAPQLAGVAHLEAAEPRQLRDEVGEQAAAKAGFEIDHKGPSALALARIDASNAMLWVLAIDAVDAARWTGSDGEDFDRAMDVDEGPIEVGDAEGMLCQVATVDGRRFGRSTAASRGSPTGRAGTRARCRRTS